MKIMFPLVSNVMEIREAKMLVVDVLEELEEGVEHGTDCEVGMMVEVPSAALMGQVLRRRGRFLLDRDERPDPVHLAVDRGNERVAGLYGANPAVIQLIKNVVRAARRRDVDVSLCGEIAGEPIYTMLLLGLGLRTLSLVPAQIPLIKTVIRAVSIEHCERIARKSGRSTPSGRSSTTSATNCARSIPVRLGGWTAD